MSKLPKYETGSDKYDNQGGRIKAIKTWDDVDHDSEDEFHAGREKILLDAYEDHDESEPSEEEVFALETGDTSDEKDEDSEISREDIANFDVTWGDHKKYYYDADDISDLEEAREEEEEALRLQKKRIGQMDEEDFLDHEGELLGSETNDKALDEQIDKDLRPIFFDNSNEIHTEVLNKDHLASLPQEEILRIIQSESPELIELLSEFEKKVSLLQETILLLESARQKGKTNNPAMKFLSIKHQILVHYLTNISFFLVLKSSGAKNLRQHPVIDALVELKITLDKLEKLELNVGGLIKAFISGLDQNDEVLTDVEVKTNDKGEQGVHSKQNKSKRNKKKKVKISVEEKNKESPLSLDNDSEDETPHIQPTLIIEGEFVSLKKPKNKRKLESTDFGDLDTLDNVDAEDKAQRRKSLRHYVAKIDQKLAKHDKAILQGGDIDLPYKDQDNSRNNRILNNKKESDVIIDDRDDNMKVVIDIDNEDDFYQAVKIAKRTAKEKKITQSEKAEVVYEDETLPDGTKRQVNYQILKNKGLTPRRKKEQRNPRVKHRNKYEKAKKKIKSSKRMVVRQEGSYGGEKTGIKTDLSRSIRFE